MEGVCNGTDELDMLNYQLGASGVPQQYWNTTIKKLSQGIFDAGETFDLLKIDYDEGREEHEPVFILQSKTDINVSEPDHIYLIDHFWTFRINTAREDLKNINLTKRLCNMLDSNTEEVTTEELFSKMWRLCNHYSINNLSTIEERLPIWYIMDEIGSAIIHNSEPNFRIIPFFYSRDQITYSLLFPIKDVQSGEFISRDFAFGVPDSDLRKALLVPYTGENFVGVSFKPEVPTINYYLEGHIRESLPIITEPMQMPTTTLKIFTEYELILQYLNHDRFVFVDEEQEADILWYTKHFKNFEELSKTPYKFVNQFPFEYVLTIKDLLCLTCRKSSNCSAIGFPNWLPITYNLKTEIANFFAYFNHNAHHSNNNYWIIKPYNLARSLDTHITDNLAYISKLLTTGPKIAQRYITNPVLFKRPDLEIQVKFDVRYVLLLKSIKPVKAYVYRNFFLRFANKEFQLNNFDDYESHFTVMNYQENVQLFHLRCAEFKAHWQQQYPNNEWNSVEKSILEMLREIFECAAKEEPPCGIADSPQSRALYAADIILEWNENKEIQPMILEINFTPDCERACKYYENFYNEIFSLLFLDEESDNFIKL